METYAIARDVYEPSLFELKVLIHLKLGGKGPIKMGIHRKKPGYP